ncbi:hypothetical protein CR513_33153, partial [Mucuna pruriens]
MIQISLRGRGIGGRALATINSPTSTIHISTLESTISIVQWGTLPTVHEEPKTTFVMELILIDIEISTSTLEHPVDQRPLLQAIEKK